MKAQTMETRRKRYELESLRKPSGVNCRLALRIRCLKRQGTRRDRRYGKAILQDEHAYF